MERPDESARRRRRKRVLLWIGLAVLLVPVWLFRPTGPGEKAGTFVGDVHSIEIPGEGRTRFVLRGSAATTHEVETSGGVGEEVAFRIGRPGKDEPLVVVRELWRSEEVSSPSTNIYQAAVATLGLTEAAEAGSEEAAALAVRGARYLLAAQQGTAKVAAWNGPVDPSSEARGGWRHTGDAVDADLSVTGWCWVALSAVDAAGLEAPGLRKALDAGLAYVRRCGGKDGFHYGPGDRISATLNSIGTLVHLLHGEEDGRLAGALRTLDPHLPAGTQVRRENGYCFYHWYYGTRANYLRGGYPWQAWRSVMIRQLLLQQEEDGRREVDRLRGLGRRPVHDGAGGDDPPDLPGAGAGVPEARGAGVLSFRSLSECPSPPDDRSPSLGQAPRGHRPPSSRRGGAPGCVRRAPSGRRARAVVGVPCRA